jgi:uracil-DNA glycosylase family 4
MDGKLTMNADKLALLEQIADEVRNLEESPLYKYRIENNYLPVIGEGNPDAKILFIGEAPGAQEASTGRPFVGNAGQVLDELLDSVGLEREVVYIANVVKDRPPGNRNPGVEEIRLYTPFLMRQIAVIQPKFIVTLGRFAMDLILEQLQLPEQGQKIGELHGKALKTEASYGEVTIVPLYHPASAFYNPDLMDTLKRDFQVLAFGTQASKNRLAASGRSSHLSA